MLDLDGRDRAARAPDCHGDVLEGRLPRLHLREDCLLDADGHLPDVVHDGPSAL